MGHYAEQTTMCQRGLVTGKMRERTLQWMVKVMGDMQYKRVVSLLSSFFIFPLISSSLYLNPLIIAYMLTQLQPQRQKHFN